MSNKERLLIGTLVLGVAVVFFILVFFLQLGDANFPPTSYPIQPESDLSFPLVLNAQAMTYEQAQARTSYAIPLPEGYSIQRVWLADVASYSHEPLIEQTILIQFEVDLLMVIQPQAVEPDWEDIFAGTTLLTSISRGGIPGVGMGPQYTLVNGTAFYHPGRAIWWDGNRTISLYSNTLDSGALMQIADTIKPNYTGYQFQSTPSPDLFCRYFGLRPPGSLGRNTEIMTFEQVQERTSYHIPLPDGFDIQLVWFSEEHTSLDDTVEQSVGIHFEPDLLLVIQPQTKAPDWDKALAGSVIFRRIDVDGILGMGADPGFQMISGVECPYPGILSWWVDGLFITLYSDNLSLRGLLRAARSMQEASLVKEEREATSEGVPDVITAVERAYDVEAQVAYSLDLTELPTAFINDPRFPVEPATLQTIREMTSNPELETAGYLDYKMAFYGCRRDAILHTEAVYAMAEAENRGLTDEERASLSDSYGRWPPAREENPTRSTPLIFHSVEIDGDVARVVVDAGATTAEIKLVFENGNWYIAGFRGLAVNP